jgi:hypothetical protein
VSKGLREGRFSLDQVGVIAERAADGSDAHYAQLAESATVTQLRTAISLAPRAEPEPTPAPTRSFTETTDNQGSCYRIRLPRDEAATFDAALASHRDALVADWKRDHAHSESNGASEQAVPFPTAVDGFMSLIEAGWDTDVQRRPHGQRTTVVVHLNLDTPHRRPASRSAALRRRPPLPDM